MRARSLEGGAADSSSLKIGARAARACMPIEHTFPHRTERIIAQDKEDHITNILLQVHAGATWVAYDTSLPPNSYQVVHHDPASDVLIMHLMP